MKIFLFVLISLNVFIYAFNTHIDAAGQQSAEEVYKLAGIQNKDQVLVWDRLFDQRIWLKSRLELTRAGGCPDILIFSSSTLGGIDETNFPNRRFVNGWMGAPTIEDLEALAQIIDRGDCHHMEIWLGMDPWFFNVNEKSDRWSSVLGDFVAYQRAHGSVLLAAKGYLTFWSRFKDRLSFVTTRESLLYFLNHRHDGEHPDQLHLDRPRLVQTGGAVDGLCASSTTDLYLRAHDGHFFGCPRFALSPKAISYLATTYLQRNTHSMNQWDQVNPDTLKRLNTALELLRAKGAKIVLIAPPYHPVTYASLYANAHVRGLLDQLDTALSELAKRNGGQYVNLRNPGVVRCTDDEFEDSHHSSSVCLRKVVKAIVAKSAPVQ
jgi:hypothetical protein